MFVCVRIRSFVLYTESEQNLCGNYVSSAHTNDSLKQRTGFVRFVSSLISLPPKLSLCCHRRDEVVRHAKELALFQICPNAKSVDQEQVELARAAVPEVRAWGLAGDRKEILDQVKRLVVLGTDGVTDWQFR